MICYLKGGQKVVRPPHHASDENDWKEEKEPADEMDEADPHSETNVDSETVNASIDQAMTAHTLT